MTRRHTAMTITLSRPALAQMDFAGDWAPVQDEDNTGNPYVGEFLGIPMSKAGSLRAQAWNASLYTLPEWQCRPHGAMYISRGPSQVRIWKEIDPNSRTITAYHAEWLRSVDNPYYMDGRSRPPALAPHSWGGFSTAEFIGDMLRITTTHLKEDYYRRNGVPSSDEATLTQYWIRRGDILTWVTIAYDPLYLAEPMIRSSEYRWAPNQQIPPYPCTRGATSPARYQPVPQGVRREIPFAGRRHARRAREHVSGSCAQTRAADQRSQVREREDKGSNAEIAEIAEGFRQRALSREP